MRSKRFAGIGLASLRRIGPRQAGDRDSAIRHAQTGYERAWCDGPPHCYKPALDEAERLLDELGAPKPKMPDA